MRSPFVNMHRSHALLSSQAPGHQGVAIQLAGSLRGCAPRNDEEGGQPSGFSPLVKSMDGKPIYLTLPNLPAGTARPDAVQSRVIFEAEQRWWKLALPAESQLFAIIEIFVTLLLLAAALVGLVSSLAELSHMLQNDAIGHIAAKAMREAVKAAAHLEHKTPIRSWTIPYPR